jgi:flagellar basal-body rod protein FlgC
LKIGENFPGFNISAQGLKIQRKKMDLIAGNIANADTVRDSSGQPYKRKVLVVEQRANIYPAPLKINSTLTLKRNDINHLTPVEVKNPTVSEQGIQSFENTDGTTGEIVHMPEHPYADENGYVQMSNVNIITEMIDMIAATRSYEANLTALNSSKEMIKDALEI